MLGDNAKEQLYELSYCTGATRADSWIDIEGGAGVLMSYAGKARRELPNATVAIDGATEALSRDGSFSAVHVLTARKGVEVQINAFNFPVWGMLEKLASAFVAGVPSIGQAGFSNRVPGRGRGAPHHRFGDDARGVAAAGVRVLR